MQSLLALVISVFVFLLGCVLACPGWSWSNKKPLRANDALVGVCLGAGCSSLLMFLCAFAGMAMGLWNWDGALVAFAPVYVYALSVVVRLRPGMPGTGPGRRQWLLGLVLLVLALAALVPALAPPSMSDWDSLAYHLSVPKLYREHGGMYYISFMSHSNFPMLTEMLYLPGLGLGNPVAAKMVHYWMGVLLVLSVIMLVRKHFSPKGALLAAVGVAGMPIVLWEATTAYIDLAMALYTVLSVYLLLNYLDRPERKSLIACGLAAGFAASTKMTGLAVIPLIAVWLLVDRYAAERKIEWKGALGFVGIALAVCSPWYIKSMIYTGNPVYPFFYSIFGGRDWTAALAANYTLLQGKFGLGHNFASFAFLPYDLTFRSDAFYDTPGLYVGPILLVGLPVLFVGRYGSRKLIGLICFFLAQLVIWFVLTQQSRYLIPAFAILSVILAELVCQDDRLKMARTALMAVFVGTAVFGVWTLVPAIRSAAPVVFGRETQADYLMRTLDIYPAQEYMNENLPKNAKVALFGDTRGFYLDRDYVWADPGHNVQFTREYSSVQEYARYLRQQGVTHAMVNFRFFPARDKARGPSRMLYDAIDSGALEPIYPQGEDGRSVGVFELKR